jgi:hypothetical protein
MTSNDVNLLIGNHFPFLSRIQNQMNISQTWIDQRHIFGLYSSMPNAMYLAQIFVVRFIKYLNRNPTQLENNEKIFTFIDAADRWESNVQRLNLLVGRQNAKYMLFLQPSIGLDGAQSLPKPGSSDEDEFKKLASNTNLLINLRLFYLELKRRCSKMEFCYDMSDIPNPSGNMYYDYVHPNEFGNAEIAEFIWKKINSK